MKAHEHFKVEHEFHKAASKECAARAEACGEQDYEKMAECDKNLSKLHSDHAAHFKAMHADSANKAATDGLNKGRNELQPTRVSAVTPTPPGVTAVPRAGQRQLQKTVDPEFASLVSSGDDRTE
jgi:hypothetical protein